MITFNDILKDRALPQLQSVMDASVIQEIFQERLFHDSYNDSSCKTKKGRFQILECEIQRAKYRPGRNCMICYRLEIYDTLAEQTGEQILCARIFEQGGGLSRFKKANTNSLVDPRYGKPLIYIQDLEMVVWAFPNDRKLSELQKIIDPGYLKEEIIPAIILSAFEGDYEIMEFENNIVHYVPEHTCTVQTSFNIHKLQSGSKLPFIIYGKTYYNDEGVETYNIMRQLWESNARLSGQLRMAQPLLYHTQSRSLWQLGLVGKTLLDYESDSSLFLPLLGKAAITIAALHMSSVTCSTSIHLSESLSKLKEMESLILNLRPECKDAITRLVDSLICQSKSLGENPIALLHCDLHLKNFFVENGKVALIDMDNICKGDPLLDIGSFLASIFYRHILLGYPARTIKDTVNTFISQYENCVPWKLSKSTLKWYVAAALINERVFRCLTRLKAGRLDIVDEIINLALQIGFTEGESIIC